MNEVARILAAMILEMAAEDAAKTANQEEASGAEGVREARSQMNGAKRAMATPSACRTSTAASTADG